MALDFPNSPTVGLQFLSGGTTWQWDGTKWVSISSTSASLGPALNNVGRNVVHNPLFAIAQRGAGPFSTNVVTLDRWWIYATLDTFTVQQLNQTLGAITSDESSLYVCAVNVTGNAGAAAQTVLYQQIEDVSRLSGKTVTVSFWAYAASGLKIGVSLDQNFGTGGSPSAAVYGNGQSVTANGAWTRYSLTFTISSIVGKTLGTNNNSSTTLNFWFSSGTTNAVRAGSIGVQTGAFYLWGVQLEIGSVATPLEKPDPRYDLANCQRFYQVFYPNIRAAAAAGSQIFATSSNWPIMRATPTVTNIGAPVTNNSAGVTLYSSSTTGGRYEIFSTAAGDTYALNGSYALSADL